MGLPVFVCSALASMTVSADAVRMSATGDYRLPEKAFVVADTPGYNSWPMIQAMGGKLVCSYSRDNARPSGRSRTIRRSARSTRASGSTPRVRRFSGCAAGEKVAATNSTARSTA